MAEVYPEFPKGAASNFSGQFKSLIDWGREKFGKWPEPPSFAILASVFLCALLGNFAFHIVHPSMAAFLSIVAAVVVLLQLPHFRTRESFVIFAVCIAAASNFFLRSSDLVVVITFQLLSIVLYLVVQRFFLQHPKEWIFIGLRGMADHAFANIWVRKLIPKILFNTEKKSLVPLLRGLAIAAVITLPIIYLLSSGDQVFASYFGSLDFSASLFQHVFITGVLLWLLLGVTLSASRQIEVPQRSSVAADTNKSSVDFVIVFASLGFVLGLWCVTQLMVALGGAESIFEEAGLTRAEYARKGFFQLVGVASVVIAVFGGASSLLRRRNQTKSGLVKAFSALLIIETVVLIGVAFSRLYMYTDAFALTLTRLSVAWFLAWLLMVLLFVAYTFFFSRNAGAPSLLPFPILAALGFTCLFGWSNPDRFIAETNFSHHSVSERTVDSPYLLDLSEDAMPAIANNFDQLTSAQQSQFCTTQIPEPGFGFLGWNKSYTDASAAQQKVCKK